LTNPIKRIGEGRNAGSAPFGFGKRDVHISLYNRLKPESALSIAASGR